MDRSRTVREDVAVEISRLTERAEHRAWLEADEAEVVDAASVAMEVAAVVRHELRRAAQAENVDLNAAAEAAYREAMAAALEERDMELEDTPVPESEN